MTVTIYHNPKCSKSRQTLALINGKGISPNIIEYLKSDLDKSQLIDIIQLLDVDIRKIMRTGDEDYVRNDLGNSSLTQADLIEAIINTPKLLERPIVINNGKAIIGRPPENVLEVL